MWQVQNTSTEIDIHSLMLNQGARYQVEVCNDGLFDAGRCENNGRASSPSGGPDIGVRLDRRENQERFIWQAPDVFRGRYWERALPGMGRASHGEGE